VDGSTGRNDTGDGSVTKPYATINKGVAMATTTGLPNIYVAPGVYLETVAISDSPAGVSIQGGWRISASGWTRDCSPGASSNTVIQGGAIGVKATGAVHRSGLIYLTVRTVPTANPVAADASGTSLVGVLITGDNSKFYLTHVVVSSGNASSGGAASAGPSSTACFGGGSICGTGAPGTTPAAGAPANGSGIFGVTGYTPADGSPGAQGGAGASGTPPSNPTCSLYNNGCSAACGTCHVGQTAQICGTPGTCGCGGGGGAGGRQGRGGGASAAVMVIGVSTKVVVTASALSSGNGGAGSGGGLGGSRSLGYPGNSGTNQCTSSGFCSAFGCCGLFCSSTFYYCGSNQVCGLGGSAGGTGGSGASGSTGGGGAGGPSYALVTIGATSTNVDAATTLTYGSGGPGAGGAVAGGSGPRLTRP